MRYCLLSVWHFSSVIDSDWWQARVVQQHGLSSELETIAN
jgi:hypothetical protein